MPAKKKDNSKRIKIFALIIIVALLGSYVFIFFSRPSNVMATPSPSSFRHESWMSFIPESIREFRFLNITELMRFPDLFSGQSFLNLTDPPIRINSNEVNFGIDIVTLNNTLVSILGTNPATLNSILSILQQGNLSFFTHGNSTIYMINASNGSVQQLAWISVVDSAIIYSEGGPEAINGMIQVLDANSQELFSNDSYKIGYLLVSGTSKPYVFSYYSVEENSYNVSWDMKGAYGTSQITKNEVYFFGSPAAAESQFQTFTEQILKNARKSYLGGPFILGDFVYQPSEIRQVLSSL